MPHDPATASGSKRIEEASAAFGVSPAAVTHAAEVCNPVSELCQAKDGAQSRTWSERQMLLYRIIGSQLVLGLDDTVGREKQKSTTAAGGPHTVCVGFVASR